MTTFDSLLGRIKVGGRPMTTTRLSHSFAIFLTRLFGREVDIEDGDGRRLRVLPIVWNKKVLLLGSQNDCIRIDYDAYETLRLRRAPLVSVTPGAVGHVVAPSGQGKIVHIMLSHLPARQTGLLLRHAQEMAPDYVVMLAYGGPSENFDQIDWPHKVFLDDPSLRGLSTRIAYLQLSTRCRDYLKNSGIAADWVFIADFDLLPLKKNFLEGSIRVMRENGAEMGAAMFSDLSLSNNPFLIDTLQRGLLGDTVNGPNRLPVYHSLGCALLLSGDLFQTLFDGEETLGSAIFELAVPTVANKKGYRLLSFKMVGDEFKWIRFRPVFSVADAMEAAGEGASFIHPVKDIDAFLAAFKARG